MDRIDQPEKPTITADPDSPDQVLIHFPEFGHLDTQVWSADLGIPAASLPALRDAITNHLRSEEVDGDSDELVCVDQCGNCDACGMEPFGTPAEGWREAARFLRRTPRDSRDYPAVLTGARRIEDHLRDRADQGKTP